MPITSAGQRRSKRLSFGCHDPPSAAMEAGQRHCAQTSHAALARLWAGMAAAERAASLASGLRLVCTSFTRSDDMPGADGTSRRPA